MPMSDYMPIPYPGDEYLRQHGAPNVVEAMRRRAHYAANDWAKRHRLPDDQDKTVVVQPHRRRLPDRN